MKRILLFYLYILSSFILIAQSNDSKRDYNWVLGYGHNTILNFNTNPPSINNTNVVFNMLDISTSISDTSGSLLFYTNGYKIFNKNYQLMNNGDSINYGTSFFNSGQQNGYGANQAALVLPLPDSDSLYYIFHLPLEYDINVQNNYYCPYLYVSIVDMSYNNGLGRVIEKNIPIATDTFQIGLLTACRHANGRDWWILLRELETNEFHRFFFSTNGVFELDTQIVGQSFGDGVGQMVFSPDGKKLIIARRDAGADGIYLNLYDFDRCSGYLSSAQQIYLINPTQYVGAAFSPQMNYLYICSEDTLFRFDVQTNDVFFTREIISYWIPWTDSVGDYCGLGGFMTLAADGKIYMSGGSSSPYLNVIQYPDSSNCHFTSHSLHITTYNGRSMPNFPHFRLGPLLGSACDTLQSVGISLPISAQSAVKVYPNPANETLHLHSETLKGNATVSLCNLLGQELKNDIWQNTAIEKELNLSHLPQGVYYLRILAGEKRFTYKIMKE